MPVEGWKCFTSDFENDGLRKKVITLYLDENAIIQTKNYVAALSMMASFVFVSLVF